MLFAIKKIPDWFFYGTLSGCMLIMSYIPFPPWALLFALVPMWHYWLKTKRLKFILLSGWCAQFAMGLIGFHWIAIVAKEFGHLNWGLSLLVLIGFSAHANLQYPLAGWLWWIFGKKLPQPASIITLVLFTALLERFTPQIFPWNLGYPWLWADLPGAQTAEWIGFRGLSTITFLMNGLILLIYLHRKKRPQLHYYIKLAVFIFCTVNLIGFFLEQRLPKKSDDIHIAAMQFNIGNFQKYYAQKRYSYQQDIFNKYIEQTNTFLKKHKDIDYIVWPEAAFPAPLNTVFHKYQLQRDFINYVKKTKKEFLIGAPSVDPVKGTQYNSFFQFQSDGTLKNIYRKSILLAFGEFFPGSHIFPSLNKLVPTIGNFGRGKGPKTFSSQNHIFGIQICYEGLFPWFSRKLTQQGAEFYLNVSNDSWFGHTFEPYQHLYLTLGRNVEFRRPTVRITNTGITVVSDIKGKLLKAFPQEKEWAGILPVPKYETLPQTLFLNYWWLIPIIEILSLVFLLLKNYKKVNQPKKI